MFRSNFRESGIKLDEKEIPEETRSWHCALTGTVVEEEAAIDIEAMKASGEVCEPDPEPLLEENAPKTRRDDDAIKAWTQRLLSYKSCPTLIPS